MFVEKVNWPQKAKSAVMVTVNLNGELTLKAAHPETEVEGTSFETMMNGGLPIRVARLLDIFDAHNVKATFFIPGWVAEKHPEQVKQIVARGHEIGVRGGYKAENLGLLSAEDQKATLEKSIAAVKAVSGVEPKGFRMHGGEITKETLKIAKDLGLTYSSSLCDDDRPYYLPLNESESILEIPCQYSLYDLPYVIFYFWPPMPHGQDRIGCFRNVLENWKWEYDVFHEEGLCYVLQLDPYTAAEPGHAFMVEDILTYIEQKGDVWFATGSQMQAHFDSGAAKA